MCAIKAPLLSLILRHTDIHVRHTRIFVSVRKIFLGKEPLHMWGQYIYEHYKADVLAVFILQHVIAFLKLRQICNFWEDRTTLKHKIAHAA